MNSSNRPPELRLVLITNNYNYLKDGAVFALNKLVQFLERRHFEVMVVAAVGREPAFESFGTITAVPSIAVPPPRSEYRIPFGIPRSVQKKIKQFEPTLIHVASPDYIGLKGTRLAKRWKVPLVASYHARHEIYMDYYGLGFLAPYWNTYLRWLYRDCVQVYAPSPGMVEHLRKERLASDVRLWSRGVDPANFGPHRRSSEWRRSLGFGDDDVVATYVSRLVAEKNVEVLRDVFQSLSNREGAPRMLIVGDGPEMANMRKALPHAVFTGHLEAEPLYRAYASSDIFFFPSVTETFGIVTLEAMASGLPVVCASSTGNNSLVEEGASGHVISADDTEGFVDVLLRLTEDCEERARMSEAALARSRQFTWDRAMETLLQHYMDVLRPTDKVTP